MLKVWKFLLLNFVELKSSTGDSVTIDLTTVEESKQEIIVQPVQEQPISMDYIDLDFDPMYWNVINSCMKTPITNFFKFAVRTFILIFPGINGKTSSRL